MSVATERLNTALAGRYKIEKQLGQGGMATVYLAQDLKHDRQVAIKVLKPELAAVLGAERFVVEIKTTAQLQHPHILPLFDSGTADGFLYYVMPYIEGETLRDKLSRETQLGIDEAVRITTQVADALDYAHRHGVIHRDIKPENILLHDGRPMVADFGIALAVSAAAGGRMTETGLSLGTPHYMSPEQATAEKEITGRSDIYSLASVLYEMLAGAPPHSGGSAQQIIMKIITDTARPVTELRKSVPPHVAAALTKALEKVPADRFASAKLFADSLGNPAFMTSSAAAAGLADGATHGGVSMRVFAATAAVAVAASAAFAWAVTRPRAAADGPVLRVPIDIAEGQRLWMASASTFAISPLGDRLVFAVQGSAGARLAVRRLSDLTLRVVVSTPAQQPTFSPNGDWIASVDGNEILKTSSDGGPTLPLSRSPGFTIRGLWWTAADTILVGSDIGLFAIPSSGGPLRRVPAVDSTVGARSPVMLADGETIAYITAYTMSDAARRLALTHLPSGKSTTVASQATTVLGMRDGHLVYVSTAGDLFAVPVDLKRQRLTGDPVLIESGIRVSVTGVALAALSASGALWYVAGEATSHLVRVRADRSETRLLADARAFRGPRFSPDGRKIAVEVNEGGSNVWVFDVASGTFTRVTTEAEHNNSTAEWSGDGRRVVFRSTRDGGTKLGIWWQPADGSGPAELLFQPDHPINEVATSPDGKWLLYRTSPGVQMRDIYAVPLQGDRTPVPLVVGPAQESHMRISPDSKWMAYASNESGRFEVFVRPFPGPGARVPVSNHGGSEPVWSRSGATIYYRTPDGGLEAASVSAGQAFTVGQRRAVMAPVEYSIDVTHAGFDVWPDGNGFVMLKPVGADTRPILVQNWGRELREKLGMRAGRQ